MTISRQDMEALAELMVGRKVGFGQRQPGGASGETVLSVEGITVRDAQNLPRVDDGSFEVRSDITQEPT